MTLARDIMTQAVLSIAPQASIHEAMEIILVNGVSGLPVVDESGRLVGIVSEADRLKLLLAKPSQRGNARVAEYMSSEVWSVEEQASLEAVATLLVQKNVRRVPVVSGSRVVGIISRRDVVRALEEQIGAGV